MSRRRWWERRVITIGSVQIRRCHMLFDPRCHEVFRPSPLYPYWMVCFLGICVSWRSPFYKKAT